MAIDVKEKAVELVKRITDSMAIACEVTANQTGEGDAQGVLVSIQTQEHSKLLIGKNGQNLQALEHVVRVALARVQEGGRPVVIDVNEYRQTKTAQLVESVKQAAGRVRDTGKPEALPPMTSYERRVVHTELASWHDVATESVGQDPQRRVVIKPL